jgi:hypothetical protein
MNFTLPEISRVFFPEPLSHDKYIKGLRRFHSIQRILLSFIRAVRRIG